MSTKICFSVSEPNLKMRSKMSLRQKVMQRNSPITHRRELITKKRGPLSSESQNMFNVSRYMWCSRQASDDLN